MARSQNRGTPAPVRLEALQAVGLAAPQSAKTPRYPQSQFGSVGPDSAAVAGKDLSEVALSLQPGMTLSGRVVFEGAAASGCVADLGFPSHRSRPVAIGWRGPDRARNTGRHLHAHGCRPGPVPDVGGPDVVAGPARRSRLDGGKSILVKGQDALEVPFQIGPHEVVNDVVVTFTDQVTDLSGARRRLWEAGPQLFRAGLSDQPRRVDSGPPAACDRPAAREKTPYRFANLPLGEYGTWRRSRTSTRRNSTSRASWSRSPPRRSRSRSPKVRKRRWISRSPDRNTDERSARE